LQLLWDENLVPSGRVHATFDETLALPKLNLQFLTFYDYLLRR
jgi:intron-binding protein aquarius